MMQVHSKFVQHDRHKEGACLKKLIHKCQNKIKNNFFFSVRQRRSSLRRVTIQFAVFHGLGNFNCAVY